MRDLGLTARLFVLVFAMGLSGCKAKHPEPDVPPGHKLCKYCCTTANVECSCVLIESATCPDYKSTATLPACAECRMCTKAIEPSARCDGEK